MCILSVCQCIKVHYVEAMFEEYITSKPTIAMSKIAINSPRRVYHSKHHI
jgi:hypothetical protein